MRMETWRNGVSNLVILKVEATNNVIFRMWMLRYQTHLGMEQTSNREWNRDSLDHRMEQRPNRSEARVRHLNTNKSPTVIINKHWIERKCSPIVPVVTRHIGIKSGASQA